MNLIKDQQKNEMPDILTDWNQDKPRSPHALKVAPDGEGVTVSLANEDGDITSIYIEVNDGAPTLHVSTNPDVDNDIHVYVGSDKLRVIEERGDQSMIVNLDRPNLSVSPTL